MINDVVGRAAAPRGESGQVETPLTNHKIITQSTDRTGGGRAPITPSVPLPLKATALLSMWVDHFKVNSKQYHSEYGLTDSAGC